MMLRLQGAYLPRDQQEPAHFGVKVIIVDVPRPRRDGVIIPDIGPGDPIPVLPPPTNGHKPEEYLRLSGFGRKATRLGRAWCLFENV